VEEEGGGIISDSGAEIPSVYSVWIAVRNIRGLTTEERRHVV